MSPKSAKFITISIELWLKCDKACNKEIKTALFTNPTILIAGINIMPK